MDVNKFENLNKSERYKILKNQGVFLASRRFESYVVSLFSINDFYVELWKRIGLNYVDYVEIVKEQKKIDSYLDNLDLPDFFA